MNHGTNDAEIIERVLGGDTERFAVLVDRYGDEFARYAKHMTGSADDAADVIQESLVRAYRSLHSCQDRDNFKGWLFRIVSNQCKTFIARRRRRQWDSLDDVAELPAAGGPVLDAEEEERQRRVQEAVDQLSAEHREVVILKYLENMSVSDMADFLSLSESALKMRLLRARRALLDKLQGVEI